MEFTFTEEQTMMASAFRELADDLCSPSEIRAAFEGTSDRGAERWSRFAELGLTGVLAPEGTGGLDLTEIEFVLIAEEAGRAALPGSLIEHAGIAVPLLNEIVSNDRAAALLEAAATGAARLAVAHPVNPFALGVDEATHVLMCREDEVHVIDVSETRFTLVPSIDPLRRLFQVEAKLDALSRVARGEPARLALDRAVQRGALFTAAQCTGLCDRLIEMAVAYAKERRQFGKPIGAYQALQHQMANARVKLEFARPVLYAAATRVVNLDARARAIVSHAKLAACDAADLAARTAIQVHGAMGYSWEVDLHIYMKRVWALAGSWGDRSFHMRRVQALVLGGEIALGPDATFDRELRGYDV